VETQSSSAFRFLQCVAVLCLLVFFFWSRFDLSERIYFFGDANAITKLIELMLESGDWRADSLRLNEFKPDDPLREWFDSKEDLQQEHFYNFAGYIAVGAAIVKSAYWLGFQELPIQTILHIANVFFQMLTVLLLCWVAGKMFGRTVAWLTAVLFVFFPLTVQEAHYVRPETWLCLLASATFCCALYRQSRPWLAYSLMGVCLGLSFAAKFNQLFLGIIPAVLLLGDTWQERGTFVQKVVFLSSRSAVILISMVIALWINTPYIVEGFFSYAKSIYQVYELYKNPVHPYFIEDYSYLNQLQNNVNYFVSTLGWLWCLFFLLGAGYLFGKREGEDRTLNLALIMPCLFLLFYFASVQAFFERNYSSVEGLISIISAVGIWQSAKYLSGFWKQANTWWAVTLITVLTVLPAARLNYIFVDRYIHGKGHEVRIDFQNSMKQDFPGFWFKNVHEAYNFTHRVPEKAPKAPRIYILKDFNGPWTKRLVATMEESGFTLVGEFRSEFYNMPTNNLTVYHQQHRYHYLVRDDELPKELPDNYLKTNF